MGRSDVGRVRIYRVWELDDVKEGDKVIGTRWVFSIKNKGCTNERYKTRLVAQEYNTLRNASLEETYAPVVQKSTIRSLLSVANEVNMNMHQMDFKTAFLNCLIKYRVIIKQPPGFEVDKR